MQNIILFHKPDEPYGFLSNWYLSEFIVDGKTFTSMEQYMMYNKAVIFEDEENAEKIMATTDVEMIKDYGRKVTNYNESVWNGVRQIIVYKGLLQKFMQNPELKEKLLETGDSFLAECAYKDVIWGIGKRMTDPDRYEMSGWKGQNLLGYSLMLVRDDIACY